LQEILSGLPAFPATLTLRDQGLFALGYYHQKAEDRRQAIARRAAQGATARPGAEDLEAEG
jgi:CRISPR-associated protein Csd1